MKFAIMLAIIAFDFAHSYAQNVGIGTASPNTSVALEVQSNDKGVLVPRIALSSANVAAPVTSPADALLIYNTATAGAGVNAVEPGFYYWNASSGKWNAINRGSNADNVGFGNWGGCASNVTEYDPVADETGEILDRLGWSVAISGKYAISGAYNDKIGVNESQGSARFFEFDGTRWNIMQTVFESGGAALDNFGYTVAILGNFAIIGAVTDDVESNMDQGSAFVYEFNGTTWIFKQKLLDPAGSANDFFGSSIAISGNYAIIGSQYDDVGAVNDQGSACIFRYDGSNWVFMQKITDATGAATDNFGSSVSISGNMAIVGAGGDAVGANENQGSACIFRYDGSNWVFMQKISDPLGVALEGFGRSVSISGNYAAVGAPQAPNGANFNQGKVLVYKYNGSSWILQQRLIDPLGAESDSFGKSISLSGDLLLIGAFFDDVNSVSDQGSACVYQRIGITWNKLQFITDPGGASSNQFGGAVAIDTNKRIMIGAAGYGSSSGKVVFGKVN